MPQLIESNGVLYKEWSVPNPKAVLLLVHGLGAHTGRFEYLSEFFNQKNFSCYGLVLKGFGESKEEPKGHIDSFKLYYNDIMVLRKIIEKENPDKKIFITGESLGALIAFQITGDFSGLICLSPAFQNNMKFPLTDYIKLPLMLLINPKYLFTMPFTAEMCSRDKAYQAIMNNDPRELRFASAKILLETLLTQIRSSSGAKIFNSPILFLLALKDQLVDPQASERIFNKLGSRDKKIIKYQEMFHVLHCDTGREKVFHDILEWLEKHL